MRVRNERLTQRVILGAATRHELGEEELPGRHRLDRDVDAGDITLVQARRS